MGGDSIPTETVTRKPDADVGSPGGPPAGGGRQTDQQAAITRTEAGGRSDAERKQGWETAGGEPGRAPPTPGGSSAGHSDQQASRGPDADRKVAGGGSVYERAPDRGGR
ncbi:hypothetical protein [Methylobacterium durans]|uniref:Uncharacterized protein n=1 Tax=Methylobacterium durans TaxID=2202825 RepID=A0A2U8W5M0_9HYPH|nr:hypothetical protein [Methylobacterium durans]AWN41349.1 hypothetical protein DK389_13530 [Methylobacterium durans]